MYDLRIKGTCFVAGAWTDTSIYIEGEKIARITASDHAARRTIDANKALVIPGIIDPHVHFELDLGGIVSVDDFYSGSVAAVHGGVTSIVDFLAPVDNARDLVKAYEERLALAEKSVVDYAFHATIKDPKDDLEVFVRTMKTLDMHTLKLFTTYSDSDRRTYDRDIIELLKLSDRYDIVILAHIENDDMITIEDDMTYLDLPRSRPPESETIEALKLAGFVKAYGGTLYMVHLSSGRTLSALVDNYPDILHRKFLIESCPQYFTFTQDDLKKGDGELLTFAPPLRSKEEQERLFELSHHIDAFGTDHCAFMKADKRNRRLKDIPLGIGGVEHSFNVMYRHLGDPVIERMTRSVARIQRLKDKGELKAGYDADLFFFEPEEDVVLEGNHGTSDYSVYEGLKGKGRITHTMIRGSFVLDENGFHRRKGKLIRGGMNDG
ncbi:MAG: dihydroorotase [Acholeplasmataceae bacterium]